MRIAIITGEYPPLEGGVGDFTRELGQELSRQGHELHILTSLTSGSQESRENGMLVYRQIRRWSWRAYPQITQWLRACTPDIVNIQSQAAAYQLRGAINFYPYWLQRRLTIPCVTTFHDLLPPYLFPKAGSLRQWAVRQLAQYSDAAIATNGKDYTTLSNFWGENPHPLIRLIHIGSNISPHPPKGYNSQNWRRAHQIPTDALLLGFFGFLNRSKGLEYLLEALHLLHTQHKLPAQLIFIGGRTGDSDASNSAYAAQIDSLIKKYSLEAYIHRTGYASSEEVSAALLAADICTLPYREGVNLRRGTLHACLAHGRAIITTRPPAQIAELHAEQNVLLVPPEDGATLAAAIKRLHHNPALRARLGKNATALAMKFSWQQIAAQTSELFHQLSVEI
ncbi:MAG: glycosyltransferase family 4 protein [Chloroflexota bacterium]|nr:glycosyltransferase family 4 protein [Chloroflexota bacterium]